jgi:hypothetical protein
MKGRRSELREQLDARRSENRERTESSAWARIVEAGDTETVVAMEMALAERRGLY